MGCALNLERLRTEPCSKHKATLTGKFLNSKDSKTFFVQLMLFLVGLYTTDDFQRFDGAAQHCKYRDFNLRVLKSFGWVINSFAWGNIFTSCWLEILAFNSYIRGWCQKSVSKTCQVKTKITNSFFIKIFQSIHVYSQSTADSITQFRRSCNFWMLVNCLFKNVWGRNSFTLFIPSDCCHIVDNTNLLYDKKWL